MSQFEKSDIGVLSCHFNQNLFREILHKLNADRLIKRLKRNASSPSTQRRKLNSRKRGRGHVRKSFSFQKSGTKRMRILRFCTLTAPYVAYSKKTTPAILIHCPLSLCRSIATVDECRTFGCRVSGFERVTVNESK